MDADTDGISMTFTPEGDDNPLIESFTARKGFKKNNLKALFHL